MFQAKFLVFAVVVALAAAQYRIEPRIVQGYNAVRGQFPFYAFLEISVTEGIKGCGGSLISDQWVLTAAHCLRNAKQAIVHLGSLRAADHREEGREMFLIESENMHIYPKYSPLFFVWNDIGLIKLPKRVTFSDVIKPIPFACSTSSDGDDHVIAIGNGMITDNYNALPEILQYVELKTISNRSCLKTHPYLIFRQSIICAKGEDYRSICDGDSGGPLISSDNYLFGAVSFGRRSCLDGSPQVFTRISQYTDWIEEKSGVKCRK